LLLLFIRDTVTVLVEIIDKQEIGEPGRGIQVSRYMVKNQREESVMVFDYKMMLYMRT